VGVGLGDGAGVVGAGVVTVGLGDSVGLADGLVEGLADGLVVGVPVSALMIAVWSVMQLFARLRCELPVATFSSV
jgi:hypothetical protein